MDRIKTIYEALVLGIRSFFDKSGFQKAVLGLSGGLDSAVVAALAVKALQKENVHGLMLPSQYSSNHSITDAVALAENLNISYDILQINEIFYSTLNSLSQLFNNLPSDVTEENIQARIRGMLLMAYSNKFKHLLLNTSNKSEIAVGYTTLYGDMCGAISVIGDVYKSDVYKLAEYINSETEIIPVNTIKKPPSAELRPNQKDSDSLPEYNILDPILYNYLEQKKNVDEIIKQGFEESVVKKIISMHHGSEYKRFQSVPIIELEVIP